MPPLQVPIQSVSGLSVSAGAATTLSGTSGAGWVSGPWAIETQDLTVDYARVPYGTLSSFDIRLDAVSANHSFLKTDLQVKIIANYSVVQDYSWYSTQAYQQPQKFEILSVSADAYGQGYGASAAGTLGPAGTIRTSQPWISRRRWNSTDSEVIESTVGFNYYMKNPSWDAQNCSFNPSGASFDQTLYFGLFPNTFLSPAKPGTFLDGIQDLWTAPGQQVGLLNGTYNTSLDRVTHVQMLLDTIGNCLGPGATTWPRLIQQGSSEPVSQARLQKYRATRHDYS